MLWVANMGGVLLIGSSLLGLSGLTHMFVICPLPFGLSYWGVGFWKLHNRNEGTVTDIHHHPIGSLTWAYKHGMERLQV